MLLIKAIDRVLDHIDAQLRTKLGLGPQAMLDEIEKSLMLPLLKDPFPIVLLEASEVKDRDYEEGAAQKAQSKENTDLKFGLSWRQFLDLDVAKFSREIKTNLIVRVVPSRKTTTFGSDPILTHNKALILFRLRRRIKQLRDEAHGSLMQRDQALEEFRRQPEVQAVRQKAKKAPQEAQALRPVSIDAALLAGVQSAIAEANDLVGFTIASSEKPVTGGLKYKANKGATELLLKHIELFLESYASFCKDRDAQNRRELSEPYAFQDMLPSTTQSKDFIAQTHLKMIDYIIDNLDQDSAYRASEAAQEEQPQGIFSSLTSTLAGVFTTYDPGVAANKRAQIASFFSSLNNTALALEVQKAPLPRREQEVLVSVDTALMQSSAITPSLSLFCVQRIMDCYNTLHADLMKQASEGVADSHRAVCLAKGCLKQ